MKSRKLTIAIKDKILQNFQAHWEQQYPKPEVTVKPEKVIRSDFVKALRMKHLSNYDDIPHRFLAVRDDMSIRLPNGSVVRWDFWEEVDGELKYEYLPVPRVDGVHVDLMDNYEDEDFVAFQKALEENRDAQKCIEDWVDEKESFTSKVREVMESVNTTKQFIDVWPEAEPFIPVEVSDPSKINLPALASIEELNKIIK